MSLSYSMKLFHFRFPTKLNATVVVMTMGNGSVNVHFFVLFAHNLVGITEEDRRRTTQLISHFREGKEVINVQYITQSFELYTLLGDMRASPRYTP